MFSDFIQGSLSFLGAAVIIYPQDSSCGKWSGSVPGFIAMHISFCPAGLISPVGKKPDWMIISVAEYGFFFLFYSSVFLLAA